MVTARRPRSASPKPQSNGWHAAGQQPSTFHVKMATDVVDLTSDGEEDNKSPSKLLKQFQPSQEKDRQPGNGRSFINGHINTSSYASSFAEGDARNALRDARSLCGASRDSSITRAQLSSQDHHNHSHSRQPTPVSRNGSGTPQGAVHAARQDFMNSILSLQVQAAPDTPGKTLNSELTRIDSKLKDSQPRQSEIDRQERVDKAAKYHERRFSDGKAQRPSTGRPALSKVNPHHHAQVQDHTSRKPGRTGFFARFLEPKKQPGEFNSLAVTAPAEPKESSTKDLPSVPPEPAEPSSALNSSEVASTAVNESANVTKPITNIGIKRPLNGDHSETLSTPAKKFRTDQQAPNHQLRRIQSLLDSAETGDQSVVQSLEKSSKPRFKRGDALTEVEDPGSERVSHSIEPELPRPAQHEGQVSRDARAPQPSSSITNIPELQTQLPLVQDQMLLSNLAPQFNAPNSPHVSRQQQKIEPTRTLVITNSPIQNQSHLPSGPNTFGSQYSAEEDALLKKLKEVDGLNWAQMVQYFNGRTAKSLQVRYSTKVKNSKVNNSFVPKHLRCTDSRPSVHLERAGSQDQISQPCPKRQRKSNRAATDEFVTWATAKTMLRDGIATPTENTDEKVGDAITSGPLSKADTIFPSSKSRILRQRELGVTSGVRSWAASRCSIPTELKNRIFTNYTLQRHYHGTSGDVVDLSWASDGEHFAAGSIAITDTRSMQYNMSRNLLVGDNERGELQELIDHHVPRPVVDDNENVNALRSMRESQDQRLFLTVTATAFSPKPGNQHWLFTTGTDKMLRRYSVESYSAQRGNGIERTKCRYSIKHSASVDLLAMHPDGFVATGCHSAFESIKVFDCGHQDYSCAFTGSPTHSDSETSVQIYPSALKWGEAPAHREYLLAGFCGDEEKQVAGETALWNMQHEQQIPIRGTTRNVFDVAWNPLSSRGSILFAVASNASTLNVGKGMRSVVQCFGQTDNGLAKVVAWECPALDINDVVFCPHDNNIIAASATDGRVYIWDQRFIGHSWKPWHVLSHDDPLNILPHDRDRELTDTGVRFLSWGATKDRLYSGSSDGIVKIWNPYRAADNCHIDDIQVPRQHRSAVMSGAFSPDHTELLIGTENGRINCLKIGGGPAYRSREYKLCTAAAPKKGPSSPFVDAQALVQSRRIVNRPCGAMPIIQAVQGPTYDGPFSAPSAEAFTAAESKLQQALNAQIDLTSKSQQDGMDDLDNEEIQKASSRVRNAQAEIEDLYKRHDFAEDSRTKAAEFQRSLADAEEHHKDIAKRARKRFADSVEHCDLPCGYQANPEGLEDTERSELRIPGLLRAVSNHALDTTRLREHDKEAGSSEVCSSCFPQHWTSPKKTPFLCIDCKLEKMLRNMRLTTTCSKCSAPVRVETDRQKLPLCERCSFACFRCSASAEFLDDAALVRCRPCRLTWVAGVLGYELVNNTPREQTARVSQSEDDEYDDFGSLERERLASRFEVDLADPYGIC